LEIGTHPKWKVARIILMGLLLMVAVVLAGRIVGVLITSKSQGNFFLSDTGQDISMPVFFLASSLLLFAFLKWKLWQQIRIALRKRAVGNILLTVGAVFFTLVVFELVMRPFTIVFSAANPTRNQFGEGKNKADFVKDNQLGFIPAMGVNASYNEYGVRHNNYTLAKPEGWRRILFIGDSIIGYGFTQKALQEFTEGKPIEYWNAGVFGYSTAQEVMFYKRFNRPVKPNLVVLGFCLNDFDGTPVVLLDNEGGNVVVSPYLGQEYYNAWLFKNSVIYRLYLSAKAGLTGRAGLEDDVKKYLAELKGISREDDFNLKVVIYPILKTEADWPSSYLHQHEQIIRVLKELGIVYYDLKPLLNETLKNHPVKWVQLTEGDYFHPSQQFSGIIAKHLLEQGLLRQEMKAIEQYRLQAKRTEQLR
jgi:hypothetical protein